MIIGNSVAAGSPSIDASGKKVSADDAKKTAMHNAAQAFEASFIAEMLKSAGVGKARDSFGGGAGEEAFSSFLVSAQAEKLAQGGGFGLSEKIYQSLLRSAGNEG